MVNMANVKMAAMKKAEKLKIRISVTQRLIITDKHNLTISIFLWVENAIELINSCLLIIKALKIQDGCQNSPK